MGRMLQSVAVGLTAFVLSGPVHAETKTIEITLKGTTFSPTEVKVPVGQNVVVIQEPECGSCRDRVQAFEDRKGRSGRRRDHGKCESEIRWQVSLR